MAEQWYSIMEYAREFDVSDMTIRRRIKSGRLHAVLKEGKYFIPVNGENAQKRSAPEAHMRERVSQLNSPSDGASRYMEPKREGIPSHIARVASEKPVASERTAEFSQEGIIPNTLKTPLYESAVQGRDTSIEMRALLAFCEASLKRGIEAEQRLDGQYKAKLDNVYEQLRHKDTLMGQLRQQIEDLQLLVQMLEKK